MDYRIKWFSLVFFMGLLSCKTQKAVALAKCIDQKQIVVIENGISYFEAKLVEIYPELRIEAAYFEFIDDWSEKKISSDFFDDSSSSAIHQQIRALDIWEESLRSSENTEREAKLFNVDSMNPKRIKLTKEFSNCLLLATEVNGLRNFLLINSKYKLSPRLAQKYLYHSSEIDLNKFENKMIFVLGTYYQTAFNVH